MNKLIEFLRDPEAKGLILGNNGFRAERPTSTFVGIWYEGKAICKITPDFIQHTLEVLPPESADECNRLTEVFAMLGKPNLRATHDGTAPRIQGIVRGDVMRWQILRQGTTFGVYV